jgi:hypothetical protein
VDGDEPYGIPEDNPFSGTGGSEEIFATAFVTDTGSPLMQAVRGSYLQPMPVKTYGRKSASLKPEGITAGT